MTPLQQRTLQVAKRHLGVKEEGGPNRGPVVEKILQFVHLAKGNPWCVASAVYFAHTAAKELGVTCHLPKTGSTSALYRWARESGNLLATPSPGCLVLVEGNAYGTGFVHTALCHDVEPGGVLLCVEGNLANRVKWNRRPAVGCKFARIV